MGLLLKGLRWKKCPSPPPPQKKPTTNNKSVANFNEVLEFFKTAKEGGVGLGRSERVEYLL